jgi:Domain of unknown function (DUF5753)
MGRQVLLDREGPPRLCAIMDEAAVRRQVGGREVMHAQLDRLRQVGVRPNVTIQMIPFESGSHPGMDGAFVVLEFPDPADQSIVYAESVRPTTAAPTVTASRWPRTRELGYWCGTPRTARARCSRSGPRCGGGSPGR